MCVCLTQRHEHGMLITIPNPKHFWNCQGMSGPGILTICVSWQQLRISSPEIGFMRQMVGPSSSSTSVSA